MVTRHPGMASGAEHHDHDEDRYANRAGSETTTRGGSYRVEEVNRPTSARRRSSNSEFAETKSTLTTRGADRLPLFFQD